MGLAFIKSLNLAVTLVIVALPTGNTPAHVNILESTLLLPPGLPPAIIIALSFATKQMAKENLLVRTLGSCETLANVSVICTDKTGALTQNEMVVVAGTVGVHAKFVRRCEENGKWAGSDDGSGPNTKASIDFAKSNPVLPQPVKDLFNATIAVNSTAFEDVNPESGACVFIGNRTESALLEFAKELGWPNYKATHVSVDIVQMISFSSCRKSMGCVVRLPDGSHRLYVKGASEILARNSTSHVVLSDSPPSANEVETAPIGELEEDRISRTITLYASRSLRTIALCYRDLPSWPPKGVRFLDNDEASKRVTVPVFDD